jgi:two-component system cell cycle response regulator DivK
LAKILLVEDNEMNRDMLSRRLTRRGHEVVVAVDGQQGLDLARSQRPALILMDMSLPVVDGWEATRQLKADADLRGTPVIALTAHAMSSDATTTTPSRSSSPGSWARSTRCWPDSRCASVSSALDSTTSTTMLVSDLAECNRTETSATPPRCVCPA